MGWAIINVFFPEYLAYRRSKGRRRGGEKSEWGRKTYSFSLQVFCVCPSHQQILLGVEFFCEMVFAILNYETTSPLVLGQIAILISR